MPLEASTTDQPSTNTFTADTLSPNNRPALSASSDMPALPKTDPVDNAAETDKSPPTSDAKPEGDGDGTQTEKPGEEKDQTSPQQRAAFARERNRRQAAEQRSTNLETKVDQLIEVVSKLTVKDQPKADPRPTRDAFTDPDAYDKALEDWASRKATEAATLAAKEDAARQEQVRQAKTLIDAYTERKSTFEADHPDFDDLVLDDDLKISPPMSQAILEAEDGPAIAYYLGQNPEVAERLSKLSPAQAVYEIGRISTRLANPPKPKPEPIRPLAARNSAGPKDPSEMSMDEYAAYRKTKAN
jgi:hypothetical protein